MSKRFSTRLFEKQDAKKRRLGEISIFENFQHPDELSLLENLAKCEHVLENIIGMLPGKDILSLTLTSKTLNLFISENSTILGKFTMLFPKIDAENEKDYKFQDIRRYPNWKLDYGIHADNLSVAMNFLQRYGEHVKSLKIETSKSLHKSSKVKTNWAMTKEALIRVLKRCKNLQELNIGNDYNLPKWTYNEPIDLPNLKKLQFDVNNYAFLALFKNCNFQSLKISVWHYRYHSPEVTRMFKTFFKAQNDLKELSISQFPEGFFDNDEMTSVSFKLKSLSIKRLHRELANNENLSKFLNLHKESLVELALGNGSCFHLFKEFKSIKNLLIGPTLIADHLNSIWPSVEKLAITVSMDFLSEAESREKLDQAFPNVAEISIKVYDGNVQHDFLSQLPKVVELEVTRGSISTNLSCSNLKSLTMNHVTINAGFNLDLGENRSMELIINCCENQQQFIVNFLHREETYLQVLEVSDWYFTEDRYPELYQAIDANHHKIQLLKIPGRE